MKSFTEFIKEGNKDNITIYLDLDGVLVDFDKHARELVKDFDLGKPHFNGDIPKTPEYEKMRTNLRFAIARKKDFWLNLQWNTGGQELMRYVFNNFQIEDIYILTAHMHTDKTSCQQKKEWVAREIPQIKSNHVICDPSKHKYVSSLMGKQILIDDRKKNIDGWIDKGGIGILHNNVNDTIKELKLHLLS